VDKLHFAPCPPADWTEFKIHYRYRDTIYHIAISMADAGGRTSVTVDGVEQQENAIPLIDDGQEHSAELRIQIAGR